MPSTLREYLLAVVVLWLSGPIFVMAILALKNWLDERRRPQWSKDETAAGSFEVIVKPPASEERDEHPQ